jgi:hypothetical protein
MQIRYKLQIRAAVSKLNAAPAGKKALDEVYGPVVYKILHLKFVRSIPRE